MGEPPDSREVGYRPTPLDSVKRPAIEHQITSADRNVLLTEYELSFENYIYRDQLAAREFYLSLVIVGVLVSVIESLDLIIGPVGVTVLVLVGLLALHVLHVDLMNVSSCKRAAIHRTNQIERGLNPALKTGEVPDSDSEFPWYLPQLSHRIGHRDEYGFKYALEEPLKHEISTSNLMVWTVRGLFVFWLFYGVWKSIAVI